MKKMTAAAVLASAVMAAMLAGCAKNDTPTNANSPVEKTESSKVTTAEKMDTDNTQEIVEEEVTKAAIAEQVLWELEEEGIKISTNGFIDTKYDDLGYISIVAENNADFIVNVALEELIVDNCDMSNGWELGVQAGDYSEGEIMIPYLAMLAANIGVIEKIELRFSIEDESRGVFAESEYITIETSAFGLVEEKEHPGDLLFEQDGVKIYSIYNFDEGNIYDELNYIGVFIENNTDHDIGIDCKNFFLNGEERTWTFPETISAGRNDAAVYSSFSADDVKLDALEVSLNITPVGGGESIFTDTLKIK